jgi:hypothetical protein
MNQGTYQNCYTQQVSYNQGAYSNPGQYGQFGQQQNQYNAVVTHIPQADEEAKADYTEFENLVNYPPGTDMGSLFAKIKQDFESADWTAHFASINALRVLNKYYPNEINGIISNYGSYIQSALSNIKPFIAKNILLFVIEFLQSAKTSGLNKNVVIGIIPILVQKTNNGQKTLQMLAEKGLQMIVVNCLCDEVIQTLCVNSATKNKIANKKAFFYLAASIDAIKENISQLNSETLKIIFQCMAYALLADCAENKTFTKQILGYMRNLMGNDNFTGYVGQLYNAGCLTAPQGEALIKAVEMKNGQRKSLADALKEAKNIEAQQQQMTKSMSNPNMSSYM